MVSFKFISLLVFLPKERKGVVPTFCSENFNIFDNTTHYITNKFNSDTNRNSILLYFLQSRYSRDSIFFGGKPQNLQFYSLRSHGYPKFTWLVPPLGWGRSLSSLPRAIYLVTLWVGLCDARKKAKYTRHTFSKASRGLPHQTPSWVVVPIVKYVPPSWTRGWLRPWLVSKAHFVIVECIKFESGCDTEGGPWDSPPQVRCSPSQESS